MSYSYYGGVFGTNSSSTHNVTLLNCIVFGNGGSAGYENFFPEAPTIRYSLIDRPLPYQEPSVITSTMSLFVSETSAQLYACSYEVDGGDPATSTATVGTTDLAANPRIVRNRIDMGAYEHQGPACVAMYTLHNGRWDDPATWSENRLPKPTDILDLEHSVTIPQSYLDTARKLVNKTSGRLIYEAGGRLRP